MGLPISKLVLATNENDILSRFFNTGVYRLGKVHASVSPSMDIQVASNFERYLYYRAGEDVGRLKKLIYTFASDGRISVELKKAWWIRCSPPVPWTPNQRWRRSGRFTRSTATCSIPILQLVSVLECGI